MSSVLGHFNDYNLLRVRVSLLHKFDLFEYSQVKTGFSSEQQLGLAFNYVHKAMNSHHREIS